MRVFVTGATGLIGFAVVKELLATGHEVTGLARSTSSAKKRTEAGARSLVGTIEDLNVLRQGASAADGVIHTAFYHKLSHMPLTTRLRVLMGGAPKGIFKRFMEAGVAADRQAVVAIGEALQEGSAFVATFGTMGMKYGQLANEDEPYNHDPAAFGILRARTEDVLKSFVSRGVRTSAIRLAPVVHGPRAFGLVSLTIPTARKKKESAYVGDGMNRWPAVHYLDAARLFRLALEDGPARSSYHGRRRRRHTLTPDCRSDRTAPECPGNLKAAPRSGETFWLRCSAGRHRQSRVQPADAGTPRLGAYAAEAPRTSGAKRCVRSLRRKAFTLSCLPQRIRKRAGVSPASTTERTLTREASASGTRCMPIRG